MVTGMPVSSVKNDWVGICGVGGAEAEETNLSTSDGAATGVSTASQVCGCFCL